MVKTKVRLSNPKSVTPFPSPEHDFEVVSSGSYLLMIRFKEPLSDSLWRVLEMIEVNGLPKKDKGLKFDNSQ